MDRRMSLFEDGARNPGSVSLDTHVHQTRKRPIGAEGYLCRHVCGVVFLITSAASSIPQCPDVSAQKASVVNSGLSILSVVIIIVNSLSFYLLFFNHFEQDTRLDDGIRNALFVSAPQTSPRPKPLLPHSIYTRPEDYLTV